MQEQNPSTQDPTKTATEPTTENPSDEQMVADDITELSDRILQITSERDQLQQQVLRTMADFQNFRKRNQQEAAQLRQFASEELVRNLLPVLDGFERTVVHAQGGGSFESVLAGLQAVEKQLRGVLEGQNVRRIPSVGEAFDPEFHEAIGTDPSSEYPEDVVTIEVEAGYKMGDKVIRPAKVRVSKGA